MPAVVAAVVLIPASASAEEECRSARGCISGETKPGVIRVGGSKSEHVPGRDRATPGGEASGLDRWTVVDEEMAPACGANARDGTVALCPAALSCPPGQIRYWVWQEARTYVRGPGGTAQLESTTGWEQLNGSYCLGPDDPGVPDYGRAIALVIAGFQDLPLPVADVVVAPAPTSLVHVATAFYAGGEQTFTQTVTPVPGVTVTVTANPVEWTWHWGDGTTDTYDTPGVPRRPVVSHVYQAARDHTATVDVSWQGSFTIAGSAQVIDIPEPAVVSSGPVVVQVREARTQLVDRS
ncbi:MAG TPA: PKD domain-containing protein [Mycobacteriales bacterium]|nr:PKD domain-containing protein [Mycobacteriales bacterium]